MRKIKYKRLSVQNFLSVGNDTLVIDFQNGLNLITGIDIDNPERRNGAGKSVIIESFYYALFGTTIREIKKEFVVNNVTKGKGCIALWFDVQTDTGTSSYKVIRQLKPSTVELWKLGDQDEDISKDSIANTNKYICDLIGSNPVICKSCDILSLSDNTPFMAKKPEEKRKFIEDIFALEIFGKMLKDLKEQIKDNKAELTIGLTKVSEISNSIDPLIRLSEEQRKKNDERGEREKKARKELQDKIDLLQVRYDSMKSIPIDGIEEENVKLHKVWENIDGKLSRIVFKRSEESAALKVEKGKLSKADGVDGSTCDKCLQNIPETHIEHIKSMKVEMVNIINQLENNIEKLNDEEVSWIDKKSKIQTKIWENSRILKDAKQIEYDKDAILSTIELQKDILKNMVVEEPDNISFEEKIKEVQDRLEKESKIVEELQQSQSDLEMCKFILGEEGIKSFIIKRLLDMLNASIQKYIISLGMTMRCKFDEYFDEHITTDTGKATTYWNFSGGERRTVDIACSWAFKDIKRKISGVSSNVEFFDEIFDAAFDPVGFDKLIEVLKERIDKHSLSCYAISHRQETLKHIDGETVNLEKENKITRRVLS
jgi:DNA repair exonuclease SbcCD ATPase subunit